MLNKRINILFEKDIYLALVEKAALEGVSVGELIRRAVDKVYFSKAKSRQEAVEKIKELRKKIKEPLKVSEIREYINYGRK